MHIHDTLYTFTSIQRRGKKTVHCVDSCFFFSFGWPIARSHLMHNLCTVHSTYSCICARREKLTSLSICNSSVVFFPSLFISNIDFIFTGCTNSFNSNWRWLLWFTFYLIMTFIAFDFLRRHFDWIEIQRGFSLLLYCAAIIIRDILKIYSSSFHHQSSAKPLLLLPLYFLFLCLLLDLCRFIFTLPIPFSLSIIYPYIHLHILQNVHQMVERER